MSHTYFFAGMEVKLIRIYTLFVHTP